MIKIPLMSCPPEPGQKSGNALRLLVRDQGPGIRDSGMGLTSEGKKKSSKCNRRGDPATVHACFTRVEARLPRGVLL
jgi:hypothetical protein